MGRRLRWLALSLVPSSLLMGVTTYISSEIAQMPFLWVIPLAIYLLTFVLVFAPRTFLPLQWMLFVQPVLVVLAAASLMLNVAALPEMLLLGSLHLVVFFVNAMVCHGQLAADRPEPGRLTEFYLWMSLGGVIGGLFSALVAPLIFRNALEYPLMMAAACMLRQPRARYAVRRDVAPTVALLLCLAAGWALRSDSFLSSLRLSDGFLMRLAVMGLAAIAALMLARRPIAFGFAVLAVAAIGLWSTQTGLLVLHAERSFFGIVRVESVALWNTHQLFHGSTCHGVQSLYADARHEPQGYYHRAGPLGEIFAAMQPRRPMAEVGILGLGAGAIAAYAEPGERLTFYEIDPAVERIARNTDYFTYLADCRGKFEVVLGDARLKLEHGPPRQFDLLVLDVFSSDAVPVHLMTREALELYRRRLSAHGIMAFHISSRYFNLEPVLGRLAADAGLTARIWNDREIKAVGWFASTWVVMSQRPEDLGALAQTAHWTRLDCDPGAAWTDDFSNIAATLVWRSSGQLLVPARWLISGRTERAQGHAVVAHALLQEGRVEDAIDQFRKSLELDANRVLEHYGLASALASRGEKEEAAIEYLEALKLEPRFAEAHGGLGVVLAKLGKLDEAMEAFRVAIRCDPKDVNAFINLGNILLERKKFEEAVKCYREGLVAAPENADLHYGLGRTLEQQGKVVPDALDELRRALPLAEQANNAALVEKIKAEIRRCEAWPWEEEEKKK